MYSLKDRLETPAVTPTKPIQAAKRRRQLHPFFFRMGPVALCITSVLLIALMAVFYLSQCGQALAANQQIQKIREQQSTLSRQNQDLVAIVAQEQSPAYVANRAAKLGLVPADPKIIQVLVVPGLQPPHRDNSQQILP
jgi:cell division protein FtsL